MPSVSPTPPSPKSPATRAASTSGAGRAHHHRNRRAGQQGHQPRRRRARPRFCHERPLRGGHRTFPGNGRVPAGMNWEKLAELGRQSQQARAHQQYVRRVRRDGNHRPAGGRQAVAGRGGRRAKRHCHARCGAGRPVCFRRRFISPAASPCWPAWPARWRKFWPVRSASPPSRNTPAPSAPPSPPAPPPRPPPASDR